MLPTNTFKIKTDGQCRFCYDNISSAKAPLKARRGHLSLVDVSSGSRRSQQAWRRNDRALARL